MAKSESYALIPDKRGAMWDVVLYIPVIAILILMALQFWYGPHQYVSYILVFSATYIGLIGFNRIAGSRLLIKPSAPLALTVDKKRISINTKGGDSVELVNEVRYFPDYAGKSFGLTGMDMSGKKQQFVFHRGQFESENMFKDIRSRLAVYK
ncbi:hypothetical protein ACFL2V_14550 [Pseudomonadota bacterium]